MVLVLLVVPALLAMQNDVTRLRAATMRALRGRDTGLRAANGTAAAAMAAWFAATLGAAIVTGAPLVGAGFAGGGLSGAFALFLAGAAGAALLVWAVAAMGLSRRRAS